MNPVCSIWKQSEMDLEPNCVRRAVRLASSVSNLTSCNELTWNAKVKDTIMTSPEREAPKTSTKRSAALWSPTGITPLGINPVFIAIKGGGRPTRRLPHAKMLLVPISFFLCWVNYALKGSTFSVNKCLVSHWEVMAHISIYCGFCLWSAGFALWCKSIFFDLFWREKLFIAAE